MSKSNPSRDQLSKSLDRRVRHLMIRTLERFEDAFPTEDESREGHIFKGDLRNMFNDVLRAQRDELHDYEIEYRPLRMTDDNVLAMTPTFLQTVQKVKFDFRDKVPYIQIFAHTDRVRVLDAVRSEFGSGILYYNTQEEVVLEIVGVLNCVDSVLPLLDRVSLHVGIRTSYAQWRQKVVKAYQDQ